MKSILDALQEGRLVELPTNDKTKALEYLALLLEAIPDIGTGFDIVKGVMEREATANTGLGKGIACPHVRIEHGTELLCAIGWSPQGIDYGASDGKNVTIVIMYYIPDSQRIVYLKEISSLAKAILKTGGEQIFESINDIHGIRNTLLDWVDLSVGEAVPDATARMIRLEERQKAMTAAGSGTRLSVTPFSFIFFGPGDFHVLSHDQDLADRFEKSKEFDRLATDETPFEFSDYYIAVVETTVFAANRVLRRCVAIKKCA